MIKIQRIYNFFKFPEEQNLLTKLCNSMDLGLQWLTFGLAIQIY